MEEFYEVKNFGATAGDLHIDTLLTNISVGYQPTGMIAPEIAPIVDVAKQSNLYQIWDKGDSLRVPDTARAPKTPANKIEWNTSSAAYFCRGWALGHELPFEDLGNVDVPINLMQRATEGIIDGLMIDWERRLANTLTTASNLGSSSSPTAWTDKVNGAPVDDIHTAVDAIHATTGIEANTMILGRAAWRALSKHPQILELIFPHGSGGKFATRKQVAELFEVDKVLVGNTVQNTGGEGGANAFSNIWGGHCVLLHVAPRPTLLTPTFMYSFRWRPPQFPAPLVVERTVRSGAGSRKVVALEAGYFQDERVVASELGFIIQSVG